MAYDKTKYIFNGSEYGKGQLVLALVKQYVDDHHSNLSELKVAFPKSLQGSLDVVISPEELKLKNQKSRDTKLRYFMKPADLIVTSEGETAHVCTEWGIGNIDGFIQHARGLGYEIKLQGSVVISIQELFEEYKKSQPNEWLASFKKCHQRLLSYKEKTAKDYDFGLLNDVWKSQNNGVAGVSPDFISDLEFQSLLAELPEITSKIIQDATPETLDDVNSWAKEAKNKGQFSTIKWGVINRVFTMANPKDYSTILSKGRVYGLIEKLNQIYNLNISGQGNWATLNINLMDAIKSQGLQSEDVFLVNTFVWWLYERLVENQQQHDNKDEEMQESNASEGFIGNVIYYGPPGTGKTYKLQGILKGRYTDKATTIDKKAWVLGKLEKLSWFEVVALILLESDKPMMVPEIKAHDYFQHKIDLNGREANISQTAWAALQTHTIQNSVTVKYQKRVEPTVFDKNEGSSWFIVDDKRDQLEELINLSEELVAGPGQVETVKRYEFVTFHQSYGYEEFIEGLRPVTNSEGDISYEVKSGVFKRLCTRAKADPQNRYAMVIDEINRGNISKIFGELITLVEIDKRAGVNNALQATLAYSEAPFSVPSNVDVIGSMNTADRSLTHIDVALRRRFEFEELRTNYCTVSDNVNGINLRRLLYAMNQRIELLLDRDHILGHALVMKVESITALKHVFKTNILPLLEEYFFENWEKIDQVLNNNGFVEEQKDARVTWLGEGDDYAPNFYFINEAALGDIESYKSIYAGVDASFFPVCDKDAIEN